MSETQLELQIISSSQDAVKALDELEAALGRVQSAISDGLKDYEDFNQQMQEFSKGLDDAISDETVEKFESLANSLTTLQVVSRMSFDSSGIASFAEEINEIAGGLNELDLVNIALKTVGPAIGQTLGNVLGHFFSSGAETIETVWNITTNFNNKNSENKTNGWMIDEALTPAVGSVLAADLKAKIIAGDTASVEVPVTFTISATASVVATITESASDITLGDMQDAAWRSLISNLDAANPAFGSGFSINNALSAEGAVVDTGITITGTVSVATEFVPSGEISFADKEVEEIVEKSYKDIIAEGIIKDINSIESSLFGLTAGNKLAVYNDVKTLGSTYGVDEEEINEAYQNIITLIEQARSGLISIEDYQTALSDIVNDIKESGAENAVKETLQNIENIQVGSPDISGFTAGMQSMVDAASSAVANISAILGSVSSLSVSFSGGRIWNGLSPIRMAASGGQFTSGEMFIARENGIPEMIGSMGNKATVANNDQIVEGIAGGVSAANATQERTLERIENLLRQIEGKEFSAKVVPSAALGKTMRQSAEMYTRNAGV